ncbi:MAG: beta-ketoacyl-ACP synthase [Paracoccaceae bacterium]
MTALSEIGISARSTVTCVGAGKGAHVAAMRDLASGLSPCKLPGVEIPCHMGQVRGIEEIAFPKAQANWDNRASRLAVASLRADGFEDAVAAACARWGTQRVGVVLGTSTSGIERLEQVYRAWSGAGPLDPAYSMRHHNDHHAVTAFASDYLGTEGPAYTISTACSSSAKSIIDAAQLIQLGLCDAVVTGGVDSLCLTSVYGFESLELLSRAPCRPFDADRDGLSIGEGAGFLLLERHAEGPHLAGFGETSDAINMSTPPEDGSGAAAAIRLALSRACLAPQDIGFLKMHGTATPANDSAESAAVNGIFPASVPAASLKGLVGHTLGAAGSVEAVMALDAMEAGIVPGSSGLCKSAPDLGRPIPSKTVEARYSHTLCNAFGFGGSNCALVFSAT